MVKTKKRKSRSLMAFSQIIILIVATFAFCFFMNLEAVNADDLDPYNLWGGWGTEPPSDELVYTALSSGSVAVPTTAPVAAGARGPSFSRDAHQVSTSLDGQTYRKQIGGEKKWSVTEIINGESEFRYLDPANKEDKTLIDRLDKQLANNPVLGVTNTQLNEEFGYKPLTSSETKVGVTLDGKKQFFTGENIEKTPMLTQDGKYLIQNGEVYKPVEGEKDSWRKLTPDEVSELRKSAAGVVSAAGSGADAYNVGEKEYNFLGLFKKTSDMHVLWAPLEGLMWATTVLTLVSTLTAAGIIPQNWGKALNLAIPIGIVAGKLAYGLTAQNWGGEGKSLGGLLAKKVGGTAQGWSTGVGVFTWAVVTYYVFAKTYEKISEGEETIEFKCMMWQAPRGGSDCNKCNTNPLMPCSEYRCKALGQTCKVINVGTKFEKCIDASRNDVTSPGIKPWPEVLPDGFSYADVKPRPAGNAGGTSGMRIVYEGLEDGCLPAFTPFEFGVITTEANGQNQPAQCKIDFMHTPSFDEMSYYMGDNNLYVENHSQVMSLPGVDMLKNVYGENNESALEIDKENEGDYNMYIRCKDGNGNENRDEFNVRFCIDKGPDVTSPVIKATSIPTGSPVLYKIDNVSVEVYTNEPANCKWSRKDSSYENMENNMSCSNKLWEMNAELLYTCETTLTSIKDKEKNQFYFRCEDLSEGKNKMQQSYEFSLIGTRPLNIIKTSPNGTVGSATSTAVVNLEVRTDNGYKNGEATCFYSKTKDDNDFIAMFQTGGNLHKQQLDLTGGDYTYYFKCIDLGGNSDSNSTKFKVFIDKYAPAVVRTYSLEGKIVIVTEEEATCKYSTSSCNFDPSKEGVAMPYDLDKIHYAEWNTQQNYYIKCFDKYDNQPNPSECSMIIRPYELTDKSEEE